MLLKLCVYQAFKDHHHALADSLGPGGAHTPAFNTLSDDASGAGPWTTL